jgi:hypothetical protein
MLVLLLLQVPFLKFLSSERIEWVVTDTELEDAILN